MYVRTEGTLCFMAYKLNEENIFIYSESTSFTINSWLNYRSPVSWAVCSVIIWNSLGDSIDEILQLVQHDCCGHSASQEYHEVIPFTGRRAREGTSRICGIIDKTRIFCGYKTSATLISLVSSFIYIAKDS